MNPRKKTPAYSWYVLILLLAAYVVAFMDRIALSLAVDPIRTDLNLTEVQISLLIGLAFVLLYTTAGIVLGRFADTGNRPRLIIIGMIVWCAATSASGLATGFATLLAARVLVGLGEATLSPASYSLISSYFPPTRLALATSVYTLGITLGSGIATWLVGMIVENSDKLNFFDVAESTDGWRAGFVLIGLIGIPFILLMFTVRDPRSDGEDTDEAAPSIGDVLGHLLQNRSAYGLVLGGYAVMAMASIAIVFWGPTYFMRVHDYSQGGVGALFGFGMAVCGTAGLLTGGWLADRLFARGLVDATPRLVLFSLTLQIPLFAVVYLTGSGSLAAYTLVPALFVMLIQGGLQGATIQLLAPRRMRGLIVAIYFMAANVIGMAVGPFVTALLVETVFGDPSSIGTALAVVTAGSSVIAIAMITAGLPAFRALVSQTHAPAVQRIDGETNQA
ncbi:MAG: MFS transporter [Henriciella sp.]|uniref:MFS transporter n=1 Tax=Henriciella sp. TaxID=1968823 RepID=UPI003C77A527